MLCSCRSPESLVRSSSSRTVQWRPMKNCLSGQDLAAVAERFCASSRISESESKTTRAGLARITASRTALVVSVSSTSDGWYIVSCVSPDKSFSLGVSSTISIPSSDHPCDSATAPARPASRTA